MAKGIVRQLRLASKAVRKEIAGNSIGGKYAAGLAGEGFAGGYLAAIQDVQLALNGIRNNNSRWWPQNEKER